MNKDNIIVFIFFTSLIFFDNDINSKVVIALVLVSLSRFSFDALRMTLKKHYPLIIFFLLNILSLIYSYDLSNGFNHIEKLAIIPAALLIFTSYSNKTINLFQIGLVYISIVLVAALYSHYVVISLFIENREASITHFFNLNYSYKSLGNTINLHTTYYSMYIIVAVIFLINTLKKQIHRNYKILIFIILIYFSIFIFQLSSRTSIAVLYFIVLFNIFSHYIKAKKLLKGGLILVIFHIVAITILLNVGVTKYRFQHLMGFQYYTGYKVNDTNHKIKLWSSAINSNDNIIFGNGIGDVQKSLNSQYKLNRLEKPLQDGYNSHNQYIEYYIGLGLLGLFMFLFLIIYYINFFKTNSNHIGLQFVFTVSLISCTECIWNRHNGIVFLVFWLFLLCHNYPFTGTLFLTKPKLDKAINMNRNGL